MCIVLCLILFFTPARQRLRKAHTGMYDAAVSATCEQLGAQLPRSCEGIESGGKVHIVEIRRLYILILLRQLKEILVYDRRVLSDIGQLAREDDRVRGAIKIGLYARGSYDKVGISQTAAAPADPERRALLAQQILSLSNVYVSRVGDDIQRVDKAERSRRCCLPALHGYLCD